MTPAEPDPAGLDPAHILTICAEFDGDAGVQAVRTADGVRVTMPARRAAWEAAGALGRVGYTAAQAGDSRVRRDVMVTGWNADRLDARLTSLRTVMHRLADNPLVTATAAVRRFAALPARSATLEAAENILGESRSAAAPLGGRTGRDLRAIPARRAARRRGNRHAGPRGGLLRAGHQRPHRPAPARRRARRHLVRLAAPADERRPRPEHRGPPGWHHLSPQRRLHRPGLHAADAPVRSGAAGRGIGQFTGQAAAGRGRGIPGAAWRRGPGRSRAPGWTWRPGRTELPRCPAGPPPLTPAPSLFGGLMELGSDQHPDPVARRDAGPGVPGRPGRLVRGHRHPGVRLPPPGPGPDRRRAGPPGPPRAERADPRRTRRRPGPVAARARPRLAAPRLVSSRPPKRGARRCRTPTATCPGTSRPPLPPWPGARNGFAACIPTRWPATTGSAATGSSRAEAMQEAAPLFARHPYARDAPSVPRRMLEAAAPGQTDGPAAGAPAGPGRPSGRGGRCGRAMRTSRCRSAMSWPREARTVASPATEAPAKRAVPPPSQRDRRP